MTVMLRHAHAMLIILLAVVTSEAFIASPSMRPPWCDRTPSCYHEYRRPGCTTGPFRLKYQASCSTCPRPGSVLKMNTENDKALSLPSPGYTDITVREAVEWTMNNDSGFTYIDVRSAEEHENLSTPRGALCIPAFERAHPVPPPARDESSLPLDEEDYNYENVEWKALPDFVDKMKAQFKLDAKLLIGYKTKRSAEACRLLAEAGFTSLYNVESRSFVKTREQQSWE